MCLSFDTSPYLPKGVAIRGKWCSPFGSSATDTCGWGIKIQIPLLNIHRIAKIYHCLYLLGGTPNIFLNDCVK